MKKAKAKKEKGKKIKSVDEDKVDGPTYVVERTLDGYEVRGIWL